MPVFPVKLDVYNESEGSEGGEEAGLNDQLRENATENNRQVHQMHQANCTLGSKQSLVAV